MHPLKQFLDDLVLPGCGVQLSTLNHVIGVYPDATINTLLKTHPDIYVLPGVHEDALRPVPHPRNTKDADIWKKNCVVFDIDIRKSFPEFSDEELDGYIQGVLTLMECDPILGSWRYAICSGNGLHLWYFSEYAFDIHTEQFKKGYEAACQLFSPHFIVQPDTACKNPARMFRLPYSKNTKKKPDIPVRMVQTQEGMISPLVEFVCTYQEKRKADVTGMLERIKRGSMFDLCPMLGYEVNPKGFILLGGEPTSIHIHPSGEFCTRFSGKPGSGDIINLHRALTEKGFIEAVIDISEKCFGEKIELTEAQERQKNLEAFQRKQHQETTYIPLVWNTPLMDAQFPPMKRYCYTVLSGETKSGKSTVAFDIAVKNAKAGRRILYITLEMTAQQLRENIARSAADITPTEERWKMQKGFYPREKEMIYQNIMLELHTLTNLVIVGRGMGSYTWPDIEKAILDTIPWDLVVIDNLDKVDNMPGQTDFDKQKYVSNKLLHFTNEYLIPVILVHHLRKPADEKRAVFRTVDALSGTGKISHDANMVIMVSRERDETGGYMDSSTFVRVAETREFSPALRKVWFHMGTFHDENPVKMVAFDITDKNRQDLS